MVPLETFPEIMRQAQEDLTANVRGRFSPEDWERILAMAHAKLQALRATSGRTELEDWQAVVLDFYRSRYWSFSPDYRPPKQKSGRKMNLGVQFLWLTFLTFTLTNLAIAWTGQNYASSGKRRDLFILLFVIALVLTNFGYFLWRHRRHKD